MSSYFSPKEGDEFETTLNAAQKRLEEQAAYSRLLRQTMEESLAECKGRDSNGTNGLAAKDKGSPKQASSSSRNATEKK
ncbi:hypothetical protein Cantr_00950 [Candida viswanathii]|uniref:Uncharacterized protein n=1 Tax=Candida viswanathii TaxID=5486 RepID=A0A367YHG7_9ASCO|nr:hypothetical protein Cantr_00950 [Candida viswanathii]